jgi:uncharacterized protein (TIGR02246 family)
MYPLAQNGLKRKVGSTPMKRILILAATLALAGCGPSEPKTDPAAEKAAIDKVRDEFMAAFNAGDAMKIGELYAENAVMMPGEKPTVTGRAAIVDYNKATFDQASAKINITPLHTTVSGEIAIDEGTYTINVTPKAAGSEPITDEGRYLVVLQKMAGSWKVINDIDNHSKAAAPPPPAAKAKAPPPKPAASKAPPTKSKTKGK